jgi:hypothetical protein
MFNRFFILISACFIVIGCSSKNCNLSVDKFTLRSIKIEDNNSAMIRGDQQKRLFGAVTLEEHKQRIGQYYTLTWNLIDRPETQPLDQPVQLVFKYQQAVSGNVVKSISKTYPQGIPEGKWEINNIGYNYAKGGRILSWRAELYYGKNLISAKESYLWSH